MSIIIMILLLCFLILVHEFGHFVAARALGIKVEKFAIGFPFGPTLWRKKIGDVEYLIHACLLGGYVAFPDDDKDSDLPPDSPERFSNNPVWKRMIVISAGVITNIITAFVLVFLVAGIWGQLPSGNAEIYVNKIAAEKGESVWNSGMQDGDKIIEINGSKINSSYALTLYTHNSAAFDGKVSKMQAKENLDKLLKLNPQYKSQQLIPAGAVITLPDNINNEPAIKIDEDTLTGITEFKSEEEKLTDKQIELCNQIKNNTKNTFVLSEGTTLQDLSYAVSDGVKPLYIKVERAGKQIDLKPIYPNKDGLIGIMLEPRPILVKTKTPLQIMKSGSKYLWDQTAMQLYAFKQLLTGKIPAKNIHGIVAVAKVGGDVIQSGGMSSGLLLAAIISAWLAILNFLPIPALDGGHFMFLIIEKIQGKPVSQKAIDILGNICFITLLALGLLIILNDIIALVKHQL